MISMDLINGAQQQINSVPNISLKQKQTTESDNTRCLLNLVMTKGEKKDLKLWCDQHDISMNFFIKLAIDDLQYEVDNNIKSISKTGVRKL